jgi:hypothetical protein
MPLSPFEKIENLQPSQSELVAAEISKETGLNENGVSWFLRDLGYGEVTDLQEEIERYNLESLLNRPEVIALAKQGIETAKKEKREVAADTIRQMFKL